MGRLSSLEKMYVRKSRELEEELKKQLMFVYSCVARTLWMHYGWRTKRIAKVLATANVAWADCADCGAYKSMLQMCEEETGIEMALEGAESYHKFSWMDGNLWDGKPPTIQQAIYIKDKQKLWIPAMLEACICIALHRDEGWGFERLGKFIGMGDVLRAEWTGREKELVQEAKALTDCQLEITGSEKTGEINVRNR